MKLTKKQAKEFARIQSGVLIYNTSGTEFDGSSIDDNSVDLCYSYMEKQHEKLLKNQKEYQLGSTQQIIDYVLLNF